MPTGPQAVTEHLLCGAWCQGGHGRVRQVVTRRELTVRMLVLRIPFRFLGCWLLTTQVLSVVPKQPQMERLFVLLSFVSSHSHPRESPCACPVRLGVVRLPSCLSASLFCPSPSRFCPLGLKVASRRCPRLSSTCGSRDTLLFLPVSGCPVKQR